MKTTILAFLSLTLSCVSAYADTFGSGSNTFDIEFVTIGNPGNADDTTGDPNPAGKVDYTYQMGQFAISEDMIDKANNLGGLGMTHDNRGANKPATSINWFEAAQFVNWLNTDSGASPAYKFDGGGNFQLWTISDAGYDPNNLYRNSQAKYVLPSMDEWYKAAYYDPTAAVYYDFPIGIDDTGPDSHPDGIDFAGDTTFDGVWSDDGESNPQPNDITNVGVLSPHGTAGQGGNVFEWEETDFDLVNDDPEVFNARSLRGGCWQCAAYHSLSVSRSMMEPFVVQPAVGFRVASTIPEPTTLLLGSLASIGLMLRRRRSPG